MCKKFKVSPNWSCVSPTKFASLLCSFKKGDVIEILSEAVDPVCVFVYIGLFVFVLSLHVAHPTAVHNYLPTIKKEIMCTSN